MKRIYALFWIENNKAMWATGPNKAKAIKRAAKLADSLNVVVSIYQQPYERGVSWDAPTFRETGDHVATFGPVDEHRFVPATDDAMYCDICGASETDHRL